MHLGILHLEDVPPEVFSDFQKTIDADGLTLEFRTRENGPFAGVEWFIPTAIVLYVTRSYFDAFLKEAGKDHYAALKAATKALWKRLRPVKTTVVATAGKAARDQPYSLVFSVVIEVGQGASLKLLIDNNLLGDDADEAIEAQLDLSQRFLADAVTEQEIALLEQGNIVGRTLLLAFNPATGRVEPMNAMTRDFPRADEPPAENGAEHMDLEIVTHDRDASFDLVDTRSLSQGQTVDLGSGVTASFQGTLMRKAEGIPEIVEFALAFGAGTLANIVSNAVWAWLTQRLKTPPEHLIIYRREVEFEEGTVKRAIEEYIEQVRR